MSLSLDFTNMMGAALPHGAGITAEQLAAASGAFAKAHAHVHAMQAELGFLTLPVNDALRDATLAVADKVMPGFGEQMRRISLEFVPTAILSRQVAAKLQHVQPAPAWRRLCMGTLRPRRVVTQSRVCQQGDGHGSARRSRTRRTVPA